MKIKNLLKKPAKGGIPANDKSDIITNMEIICKLLINFNSFKVFNHLVSNKKKIRKVFNNIIMYINMFKNIKEKLYSLNDSKTFL